MGGGCVLLRNTSSIDLTSGARQLDPDGYAHELRNVSRACRNLRERLEPASLRYRFFTFSGFTIHSSSSRSTIAPVSSMMFIRISTLSLSSCFASSKASFLNVPHSVRLGLIGHHGSEPRLDGAEHCIAKQAALIVVLCATYCVDGLEHLAVDVAVGTCANQEALSRSSCRSTSRCHAGQDPPPFCGTSPNLNAWDCSRAHMNCRSSSVGREDLLGSLLQVRPAERSFFECVDGCDLSHRRLVRQSRDLYDVET